MSTRTRMVEANTADDWRTSAKARTPKTGFEQGKSLASMIEARPVRDLNRVLPEWKALRERGWDVSVVVGEGRAIMLACRSAATEAQLSLLGDQAVA